MVDVLLGIYIIEHSRVTGRVVEELCTEKDKSCEEVILT